MIPLADNEIIAHYPYPLVLTYARVRAAANNAAQLHDCLLDLFEMILKYCAAIMLTQYLADGLPDPRFNRSLRDLKRPSLGHWLGWLRDLLRFYHEQQRPLQLPELAAFYSQKHGGAIFAATKELGRMMASQMDYRGAVREGGTVTTQEFFELLGTYRNKALGHGARLDLADREQVVQVLWPALQEVLAGISFIRDYPLVYVEALSGDPAPVELATPYIYQVTDLDSPTPTVEPDLLRLEQPAARERVLYLLRKQAPFLPLLNLHPFLIYRNCKKCQAERVFVFNPGDVKGLTYLSYGCTHQFSFYDYLDDIRDILGRVVAQDTSSGQEHRAPAPSGAAGYHPGMVDVSNSSWPVTQANGQYIAGRELEYHPLRSVEPDVDDRAYIAAIRDCYRPWREEMGWTFGEGAIIPPPAFVPSSFTQLNSLEDSRNVTPFWTLARVDEELLDTQRLLVLGGPGSGKTTLLQFFARHYAQPDSSFLPVLVSLRAWRDPPDQPRTLLQFIKDFLAAPLDQAAFPLGAPLIPHLDSYLANRDQQRRLVFLLDDYDRLPQDNASEYQRCLEEIRAFAGRYKRARIVVACRSLDYNGTLDNCDPPVSVVQLNPWSPAEISEYVRCNAPDWEDAAADPRLLDLANIPLHMVQLIDIARIADLAPAQVLESSPQMLFQAFVDRLFTFAERAGRGPGTVRSRAETMLARLATALRQAGRRGGMVPLGALDHYLGAAESVAERERLLHVAADATIVTVTAPAAAQERQVGFAALSLEDYFAEGASAPATSSAALQAAFASGQPDAVVNGVLAMDNAGKLDNYG